MTRSRACRSAAGRMGHLAQAVASHQRSPQLQHVGAHACGSVALMTASSRVRAGCVRDCDSASGAPSCTDVFANPRQHRPLVRTRRRRRRRLRELPPRRRCCCLRIQVPRHLRERGIGGQVMQATPGAARPEHEGHAALRLRGATSRHPNFRICWREGRGRRYSASSRCCTARSSIASR